VVNFNDVGLKIPESFLLRAVEVIEQQCGDRSEHAD
jgi:hypothetical protein